MSGETVPKTHTPPFTRRIGTRLTALVAVTTFGTFAVAVVTGLKVQERYLIAQAIDGAALFGDTITRATHDQMLRGRKLGCGDGNAYPYPSLAYVRSRSTARNARRSRGPFVAAPWSRARSIES